MFGAIFLCCALGAVATDVTPVEKVITMMRDLQTQVQEEGKKEAGTYDKFACFCKSKTDEKSEAIQTGQISVETLQADLASFSATRDQLDIDINNLNEEIKGYNDQVKEGTSLRAGEKATFEAALADMDKAVSSLERAVKTLKASGAALIQKDISPLIKKSLLLADAMDIKVSKKAVTMLLSEEQPVSDYDFHSGDIVSTIEGLLNNFRAKRVELENDDAAAQSNTALAMQAKGDQISTAQTTLEAKQKERSDTTASIAQAQTDLTETNAILNDDRVYLKDLTSKCETKAKEWDQRSAMRADELAAITQALAVVEGTVANKASITGAGGREAPVTTAIEETEDVSFVQVQTVAVRKQPSAQDQIRMALVNMLSSAGKKLKSPAIAQLAMKVQADPFVKIKGLIQELIERLLEEEADEANHKGWCDTELSKVTKDREYKLRNVEELHSSLEKLNARKGSLTETKAELTKQIAELTSDYTTAAANREEESAEHAETISESKEGEEAVGQAIDILSHFYGEAAQATVELAQQSPDDDAPDTGFDGAYTGSTSASTGIIGMMDVIKSDFARTISETAAAEEQAKRDFVEFERETQSSITTKSTGLEHTNSELAECESEISSADEDIRTEQELLDGAVQAWEEMLPGCVADPGMSYEERVQRRNAEVASLKDAYCILNNEEAGCSGVFLQKRVTMQ